MRDKTVDVVVIGSGMGGGTAMYHLASTGASVLVLERGDFLPTEDQNWSPEANFSEQRYKNAENWKTPSGQSFKPGVHYYVGGNTKVFGAALPRFRTEDFQQIEHFDGVSPAWPIIYQDLEPYYTKAEQIYRVHGLRHEDPTDPARTSDFPFPPVSHEPVIEQLADSLQKQGLTPFHIPLGVDLTTDGGCIRCATCDGYPCKVKAKSDAEVCAVIPALRSPNVELWTNAYARTLTLDSRGKQIESVEGSVNGEMFSIKARHVVLACGAVNSAALLLRSSSQRFPEGLANNHDLVGRHYMVHNNSALLAVNPFQKNSTTFQKTLAVNDFYHATSEHNYPLGNLQLLGKLNKGTLSAARPRAPKQMLSWIADHSVEWWVMSEDLPDPDNRIRVTSDGSIQVDWTPNNLKAHKQLLKETRRMMRKAGYPIILSETLGIATNSHQCGTLRMGTNETNSVVDQYGKIHSVSNGYVVDSSVFPSSAACNPALTIAALALRSMEHLSRSW